MQQNKSTENTGSQGSHWRRGERQIESPEKEGRRSYAVVTSKVSTQH